jgi:hypothetical protein
MDYFLCMTVKTTSPKCIHELWVIYAQSGSGTKEIRQSSVIAESLRCQLDVDSIINDEEFGNLTKSESRRINRAVFQKRFPHWPSSAFGDFVNVTDCEPWGENRQLGSSSVGKPQTWTDPLLNSKHQQPTFLIRI